MTLLDRYPYLMDYIRKESTLRHFRRKNGTFVDRDKFINAVKKGKMNKEQNLLLYKLIERKNKEMISECYGRNPSSHLKVLLTTMSPRSPKFHIRETEHGPKFYKYIDNQKQYVLKDIETDYEKKVYQRFLRIKGFVSKG
ncbi:hypothetical protein MHBO_002075 [Bonamia ostreae]|uniref:Uncharacterized protein n=1 Tax=Bonamia ostreae TaxID=126728 RepID=A0ABV2AL55_9EUKA